MRRSLFVCLALLCSSAFAQQEQVLYNNSWETISGGDGSYCGCVGDNGTTESGTTFTLTQASSINAVAFYLDEQNPGAGGRYGWQIYNAANGMPVGVPEEFANTGRMTPTPIASGLDNGAQESYEVLGPAPALNPYNDQTYNMVTVAIPNVRLTSGTYFFGMYQLGSDISPNYWLGGVNPAAGGGSEDFGIWSSLGPASGLALTVLGTQSVSAPEIDPASATVALTLLCGVALVLKSRRRTA